MHKPIIRKFDKTKVQWPFIDDIWGADPADMQLISKFDKASRFFYVLLTFIANMHGLYPWKIRKDSTITNAFQIFFDESKRKPNEIWVDKGSEFYNRSMKSWLEKWYRNVFNASVIGERFIRTLRNKIYKYMTTISKMFILIN